METTHYTTRKKISKRIIEFSMAILSLFALAEATVQVMWVAF